MMYCVWIIHVKGRYNDLYMFLVSHYLLIYIFEAIHDICLNFVVCEIKKLFLFFLYFPHMRLCILLSVSGNIQVEVAIRVRVSGSCRVKS